MAGTIIADFIRTDANQLSLNVGNTTFVTMNSNGMYSNTGVRLIAANGTISTSSLSGTIPNTSISGTFPPTFLTTSVQVSACTSGQLALSSSISTYTDLNVSLSLDAGTWAVFYAASLENQNISGSGSGVQGVIHYLSLRTSGGTVIQTSQLMYANYEKTYEWDSATFMKILTVASTTTYKLSHFWQANSGSPSTSNPYCRPDNTPTQLIAVKLY